MPIALLALSLLGVLAGCNVGAPSGATKTTQTATARAAQAATAAQAAQATRAAEPVWTSISVQQEGTIAENNVHLNIAVTVTNRTSALIHVFYTCGYAPVIVTITPVNGQGVLWTQDTYSCPAGITNEDPHQISSGASYTFTYVAPLSQYGAEVGHGGFHVGEYQVIAKYDWHQGTLDQGGRIQACSKVKRRERRSSRFGEHPALPSTPSHSLAGSIFVAHLKFQPSLRARGDIGSI